MTMEHSSFMHCDLHWGRVLRNRQYVNSLLSQCLVSWGSTNYTALWVTGYLGDLSAALEIDDLQQQAVDRRCCKKPSRLRNWSVCTHPTFTRRTGSELFTVYRPKPCLPSSGLFKSHPFFTSSTHSVSAQSVQQLTAPILAAYVRSIIEYF